MFFFMSLTAPFKPTSPRSLTGPWSVATKGSACLFRASPPQEKNTTTKVSPKNVFCSRQHVQGNSFSDLLFPRQAKIFMNGVYCHSHRRFYTFLNMIIFHIRIIFDPFDNKTQDFVWFISLFSEVLCDDTNKKNIFIHLKTKSNLFLTFFSRGRPSFDFKTQAFKTFPRGPLGERNTIK